MERISTSGVLCMFRKCNVVIYVNVILICNSICSLLWRRTSHANMFKKRNFSQLANLLEHNWNVYIYNCGLGFSTLTSSKSRQILVGFWLFHFDLYNAHYAPPVLIIIVLFSHVIHFFPWRHILILELNTPASSSNGSSFRNLWRPDAISCDVSTTINLSGITL